MSITDKDKEAVLSLMNGSLKSIEEQFDLSLLEKYKELASACEGPPSIGKEETRLLTMWMLEHELEENSKYHEDIIKGMLEPFDINPDKRVILREFKISYGEICIRVELSDICSAKFTELDVENTGELGRSDVMVLLDSLLDIYENRGCSYNQKVSIRTKFINKFNLHGERKMMKEEFSILFDDICSEMSIFQRVNETFRELDVNGNGYLDEPEIMDLAEWILSTNRRNGTISEGDRTAMMKKIKKRCNVGVRSRVNLNEVSILLAQVVEERTVHEAAKLKFKELDKACTGYLSANEVVAVAEWLVQSFHLMESVDEVRTRLLHRLEEMRDEKRVDEARLGLSDFELIFTDVLNKIKLLDMARIKFKEFDVDENGKITSAEVANLTEWIMNEYHSRDAFMTPEEKLQYRDSLLQMIDTDGDGHISLEEFAMYFYKLCALKEKERRTTGKFTSGKKSPVTSRRKSLIPQC